MSDGFNMADMFGQLAKAQEQLAAAQEALAEKTVSAEAGGGMVKVTANGLQRVTSLKIDPDAVDPEDLELLEDLVIAGVNKALEESAGLAQAEMARAAGGIVPPDFDPSKLGL